MAQFASLAAAEARAKAMMQSNQWVVAHSARLKDGAIAVRYLQFMTKASASDPARGGWRETTDDTVT